MTFPSISTNNTRGFESSNSVQSSASPLTEEKNNLICLAFSRTMNNIKDLFSILETRIASSMEKFQIASQKMRISLLEIRSGFYFDVKIGGSEKDSLDIQEALLDATLSEHPSTTIYLDNSRKLCSVGDSRYCITFFSDSKQFMFGVGVDTNDDNSKSEVNDPKVFYFTNQNNKEFFIKINTNSKITESQKKEQTKLIYLVFLDSINKIKNLFTPIGTRISAFIETLQIAKQQEKIVPLVLEPNFYFKIISKGSGKDLLDIEDALLRASLSATPKTIYIDDSGKLCKAEKSAFSITFSPEKKMFIHGPGLNTDRHVKVDDQLIIQQPVFEESLPKQVFHITDENNNEVLSISIYIHSEITDDMSLSQ